MIISKRAKNLAAAKNIDIRLAVPTGPRGRVIERDIRKMIDEGIGSTAAAFDAVKGAAAGAYAGSGIGGKVATADLAPRSRCSCCRSRAEAAPAFEDVKFTGIRKAIVKSMTTS